MAQRKKLYEDAARLFVRSIAEIASKPRHLDNLEAYLTHHFEEWLQKWANTPEGMAYEMKEFANLSF